MLSNRERQGRAITQSASPHLAIAAALFSVVYATSGCSSSSDSGAFDDFTGSWKLTSDMTKVNHFRLTCPDIPYDSDIFQLFTNLTFEDGTVSDLYESTGSGDCQFAFDAVPKVKAVGIVTPDPFTGVAPVCTLDLGNSQDATTGDTIDTQMMLNPSPWAFNLQPTTKGKAPTAQLVGHAEIDLNDIDTTLNPPKIVGTNRCTFDILENLDKVSKF